MNNSIELIQMQTSIREMTADEIMSMVIKLASRLQSADVGEQTEAAMEEKFSAMEAQKSIKEKTMTRLECGKVMKSPQ